MPTILEEAEDTMEEAISKGGRNYVSRGIANLFLNDRKFCLTH